MKLFASLRRVRERRMTIRTIGRLSDHLLQDIGLERDQVSRGDFTRRSGLDR